MLKNHEYRYDVQALRGVAVLAILLFHASNRLFPIGYLGVDVFFVISGFVVTPLILRIFDASSGAEKITNMNKFYVKRFYRLVPALVVTLILSTFLIFFLGPTSDHQRIVRQGIATIFLIGNVGAYKYSGDYFQPDANPLVHTWSLSVEEQIYILLPLCFLLLVRSAMNLKSIALRILISISVISFLFYLFPRLLTPIYSLVRFESFLDFSFYSPINRIWQFSLGGIIYLLISHKSFSTLRFKPFSILLLITLFLCLFSQVSLISKLDSILATLVSLLIITFRSLELLPNRISMVLKWLGDRSYSIYLLHMPLIYLVRKNDTSEVYLFSNTRIKTLFAIVLTLILANFMYSKVENRFRQRINTDEKKQSGAKIMILIGVSLLIMIFIEISLRNQYWGLQRDEAKPPYAGFLDQNCERDSLNGPPCLYPYPKANRTVLLLGDSHAGDVSQALIDAAHKQGWNAVVWTHRGNVIQFTKSTRRQDSTHIENNINKINWIMKYQPDLIIISQYVRFDDDIALLKAGISSIINLTDNVLLLYNRPIFSSFDNFMNPRPLLSQILGPADYATSANLNMMEYGHREIEDELVAFAKEQKVMTLNLWPIFCDLVKCTRYFDGSWLYRDYDHFSITGAKRITPFFQNHLDSIK